MAEPYIASGSPDTSPREMRIDPEVPYPPSDGGAVRSPPPLNLIPKSTETDDKRATTTERPAPPPAAAPPASPTPPKVEAPTSEPPALPPAPKVQAPKCGVKFALGLMGTLTTHYHRVISHGNLLILLYDTRFEGGTEYEPPVNFENAIEVTVMGGTTEEKFTVASMGIVFPLKDEHLKCTVLICQDGEAAVAPDEDVAQEQDLFSTT